MSAVPTTEEQSATDRAIGINRMSIDMIDRRIIDSMRNRRTLSQTIQKLRIEDGGVRTELGREREIRAEYIEAFGPAGGQLADAILTICRGTLVTDEVQ